tara:strand:+ start:221 stop:493 length:273 start_codon:yes stop_codon:yes gene_type:complete
MNDIDEINSGPSSILDVSNLKENAPFIAILGSIIFFVVAHPFVFKLVDSVIESVLGTGVQRDLLVLLHSIVFGALMFGSIYLLDYVMTVG